MAAAPTNADKVGDDPDELWRLMLNMDSPFDGVTEIYALDKSPLILGIVERAELWSLP
jgi:hypothetical protein